MQKRLERAGSWNIVGVECGVASTGNEFTCGANFFGVRYFLF